MAKVRGRSGAGSNRGRALRPELPRVGRPGRNLAGAVSVGYAKEQAKLRPYPKVPDSWQASALEWIVYWWFKYKQKWVEGEEFYYNGRIFVPGLYSSTPFTQADFIIDLGPTSRAGNIIGYNAIVLDPFTEFTHDKTGDLRRKLALDKEGYLLIYLSEQDVQDRTDWVIREALNGVDHSNRGAG